MRALLGVALVAMLFSGCAGSSGGLNTYIILPGDVPADCSLTPMSDEEMQEAKEEAGLTSNPGKIRNDLFEVDGITPVDNLISVYDCGDEDEAFSQAIQFANEADASGWVEAVGFCEWGGDDILRDGAILVMGGGDERVEASWHARVTNQTGAGPAC